MKWERRNYLGSEVLWLYNNQNARLCRVERFVNAYWKGIIFPFGYHFVIDYDWNMNEVKEHVIDLLQEQIRDKTIELQSIQQEVEDYLNGISD